MDFKFDRNNLPEFRELMKQLQEANLSLDEMEVIINDYQKIVREIEKEKKLANVKFAKKYGIEIIDDSSDNFIPVCIYDDKRSNPQGVKEYYDYVKKEYDKLANIILKPDCNLTISEIKSYIDNITPFPVLVSKSQYEIIDFISEEEDEIGEMEGYDYVRDYVRTKAFQNKQDVNVDYILMFYDVLFQENLFSDINQIPKNCRNKEDMCRMVLQNPYMYSGAYFDGLKNQFEEILNSPHLACLMLEVDSRRSMDIPCELLANKKFWTLLEEIHFRETNCVSEWTQMYENYDGPIELKHDIGENLNKYIDKFSRFNKVEIPSIIKDNEDEILN